MGTASHKASKKQLTVNDKNSKQKKQTHTRSDHNLYSVTLLVDGYQRTHCHSKHQHFNIQNISHIILEYFHIQSAIYDIHKNMYWKQFECGIPTTQATVSTIHMNKTWFILHYTNGDVLCYNKMETFIGGNLGDGQWKPSFDSLPCKNIQSLLITSVKTSTRYNHTETAIFMIHNFELKYFNANSHNLIHCKFIDSLNNEIKIQVTKVYSVKDAHYTSLYLYILSKAGEIYIISQKISECNFDAKCIEVRTEKLKLEYLGHISYMTVINQIVCRPDAKILFVVASNGLVYFKCDSTYYDAEPLLYKQYKQVPSDADRNRLCLFRLFYKNDKEYIRMQQIGLGQHWAVALSAMGNIYCWGSDPALTCGRAHIPSKLKFSINENEEIKVEYGYLSVAEEKEKDEIKFDEVVCGHRNSFIIANTENICVGWSSDKYYKKYLNEPKRMSIIERFMECNKYVKLMSVHDKTFVFVQHY